MVAGPTARPSGLKPASLLAPGREGWQLESCQCRPIVGMLASPPASIGRGLRREVLQALSFRPEMERDSLAVGVHHSGISLRMGGLAGREI